MLGLGLQGGEPFAFAGLWDRRDDLPTCAIITGSPNELIATVHNRMPMILARESVQGWIEQEEITAKKALGFLASCSADMMERHRASAAVNNPRRDASDLQT
jgi:putative SOS response-associated peptidase YedK